jgi:hypothetical protein
VSQIVECTWRLIACHIACLPPKIGVMLII